MSKECFEIYLLPKFLHYCLLRLVIQTHESFSQTWISELDTKCEILISIIGYLRIALSKHEELFYSYLTLTHFK